MTERKYDTFAHHPSKFGTCAHCAREGLLKFRVFGYTMDEEKSVCSYECGRQLIESLKHYDEAWKEHLRQVMIMYLSFNDKNGCYEDEDSIREFGEKMSYETAVAYYLAYANEPVLVRMDMSEKEPQEQADFIEKIGMDIVSMAVLERIAEYQSKGNTGKVMYCFKTLAYYGAERLAKELLKND